MKQFALKLILSGVSASRKSILTRRSMVDGNYPLLYDLAMSLEPLKAIAEVGTFMGWSTAWLAAVAHERGVFMRSYDIDATNQAIARNFLNTIGLVNQVLFVTVEPLGELFDIETANFWFIDGDHSYTGAKRDYDAARKAIGSENGLIVFDNAYEYHSDGEHDGGVPKLMAELGAVPVPDSHDMAMLRIERQ